MNMFYWFSVGNNGKDPTPATRQSAGTPAPASCLDRTDGTLVAGEAPAKDACHAGALGAQGASLPQQKCPEALPTPTGATPTSPSPHPSPHPTPAPQAPVWGRQAAFVSLAVPLRKPCLPGETGAPGPQDTRVPSLGTEADLSVTTSGDPA